MEDAWQPHAQPPPKYTQTNVHSYLRDRELGRNRWRREDVHALLEAGFVQNHEHVDYDLPDDVLSTIAIAISPDGETVATTHGDHTVKVFSYATKKLIRVFRGHPRTPWTVKFHPIHSHILASGCLGGEVRLWDVNRAVCVNQENFSTSIISLAFHPQGNSIAVASGPALFLWNYQGSAAATRVVALVQHTRTIKAVMFHPGGNHLLIAAPDNPRGSHVNSTPCRLFSLKFPPPQPDQVAGSADIPVKSLADLPTVLPRVHLYSDGGLDISPDGQYLFACAVLAIPTTPAQVQLHTREQILQSPGAIADAPESVAVDGIPSPRTQHLYPNIQPQTQFQDPVTTEAAHTNGYVLHPQIIHIPPQMDMLDETGRALMLDRNRPLYGSGANTRRRRFTPTQAQNAPASSDNSSWTRSTTRTDPTASGLSSLLDVQARARLVGSQQRTPMVFTAEEHVCLFRLETANKDVPVVSLAKSCQISKNLMLAVTSAKLSPTATHGLLGYGVRKHGFVEKHPRSQLVACEIFALHSMESVAIMNDDVDEVNIAQFHTVPGNGIVYGTKRGRVRAFERSLGSEVAILSKEALLTLPLPMPMDT